MKLGQWLLVLAFLVALVWTLQWINNWFVNPKPREYYQERGYFPE